MQSCQGFLGETLKILAAVELAAVTKQSLSLNQTLYFVCKLRIIPIFGWISLIAEQRIWELHSSNQ